MLKRIIERYPEEEIMSADGFDDAVIGIDESSMRLIYSVSKCLTILEKEMTVFEAIEYFDYNVANAYMGEQTPIWCYDDF